MGWKVRGGIGHVLVNDLMRGYGIFIESMLETEESGVGNF
ncbi:hypothetical protein LIZ09_10415 [Tyzzerella nexilis]|nr:hypothetical protein [[Clostridium] nexile]MCB7557780.1 hypothetical protein [[Clostridium] nexile]MCC3675878.1 hypothetical protein [[Clostridium] nexile]NSD85929.1 hypothetical protein [[Clostridium] nexile]NSD88346.1 hypothetical protein [[Clostridium] nexile]